MDSNDEQQEKQQYLVEQIIEQGHQPDDFQRFLETIKPGLSTDISAWTLAELKDCVHRFKSVEIDIHTHLPKPAPNEYFKTVRTSTIVKSVVGQTDNLDIRIVKLEKIPGGFFSSAYTVFRINTVPQQWSVQRKYSDFVQLHEPWDGDANSQGDKIFEAIDGFNVPQLGRVPVGMALTAYLSVPELLNNPHFELFLSLSTEKDWNAHSKNILKQPPVRRIDHVQTISGEVPVRINQDLNLFFDNAEQVIGACNVHLRKARQLSKQLIIDLDHVQATLYSIGEVFTLLQGAISQYKEKTYISEFSQTINTMTVEWGNYVQEQKQLINRAFNHSLKFTTAQTVQLVELIQQRDQGQQDYFDYHTKLLARKEKLFAQDASRWEIDPATYTQHSIEDLQNNRSLAYHHMLPKVNLDQLNGGQETWTCRELKNIFGFYNQRVYEQIVHTMNASFHASALDFLKFTKNQSLSVARLHHLWAEAITNLQLIHDQSM